VSVSGWPDHLPALRVRIARPTDDLEALLAFYRDALGLPVLGGFRDHEGYDGAILGMPGREFQLEFTRHRDGSPCPAPTRDNLLVLYFQDRAELDRVAARLHAAGYPEVEPENPYWRGRAVTVEDPDGWRVVLSLPPG